MQIRKASLDDVPGIRQVCSDGYRDTYTEILSRETIERIIEEFYNSDRLKAEVCKPKGWNGWWVADADGTIRGAAGGGTTAPEVGEVFVLYVDPGSQGKGIGTRLLDAVIGELVEQGAGKVWVSVFDGNNKGIGFYQARGFVARGKKPKSGSATDEEYITLRFCRELSG